MLILSTIVPTCSLKRYSLPVLSKSSTICVSLTEAGKVVLGSCNLKENIRAPVL